MVITSTDSLNALSVDNGKFAFTTGITGLQTFPLHYEKGIPLGTESEWGWHRFPNPQGYQFAQSLREYQFNGRPVAVRCR